MSDSLAARLWAYQAERFPLAKTVPLLAVFSAASISVSAVLAGRPLPGLLAYLVGFTLVFVLFFQLRVCDEVKDSADDARYRPERPIPRGLVSLRLIVALGVLSVPVAIAAALVWGAGLVWLLALVWMWLAAMTMEFGSPVWLKARPVLYLLTHMAIMPLIDLMLTGIEWRPHGGPPPGLWLFIGLSFANGCVLELGRKLWAPSAEREGVETYSALWGPKRAAQIWLGLVGLSFLLLLGVGIAVEHWLVIGAIGLVGLAGCAWAAREYVRHLGEREQKSMDRVAGLWVFLCYATAGFVPLLLGAAP